MKKITLAISLLAMFLFLGYTGTAMAQSTTAGDISGTVADSTGAVIPGASVTVKNVATGATKTDTSSASGGFRISLLPPGSYAVTVTASGFSTSSGVITVSAGTVATDNVKLAIGKTGTIVEVTGEPVLINTENGDVSTTFTAEQVQSLPNPGNDLTFVAQTAPGSIMNTGTAAGGYGNFSSFGISGLSNMFTLDGGYENDPFLNLNNTGASNLTLGNNEVDTVTVVSPAYSAQFGGLGGAQVNEITAGGGNRIHGNANYYWDGRVLNSNDYFNKQSQVTQGLQNIPQFVNANQWGAAIGGPIYKDKLFWFVNTEGIRATTPQQGTVAAPNALVQACSTGGAGGSTAAQNATVIPYDHYILNANFGTNYTADVPVSTYTAALLGTPGYGSCGALNVSADTGAAAAFYNANVNTGTPVPTNNADEVGLIGDGIPYANAVASQVALLNRIFSTYNNSPFRPAAANVSQDPYDPTSVLYFAHNSQNLTEWLLTGRIDYKIGDKDNFYIHYKQDHGTQPTSTDLVSPLFTVSSLQPAWEGQMSETHNFTPNFVNQLVVTGNYYSAPFQNSNPAAAVAAAAPSTLEFESGDLGTYYYPGYAFPQGRRVAGYQVIDDASYTKGRNTVRWGYNIRRDNITDIQGVETTTPVDLTYSEDFYQGIVDYEHAERFPVRPTQPVSLYDEGGYVEDSFKLLPNFTVTAGLRIETNSNPVCHTSCFSVIAAPVTPAVAGSAPTTSPYNSSFTGGLITGNQYRAFKGYQNYAPMPRVSFNWSPMPKTVIRGGFGMFTDSFPGLIADDLLSNAPGNFHAAVYGYASGLNGNTPLLDPSTTGSAHATAVASNNAFHTGFYAGQNETQIAAAVAIAGGTFSTPSVTTVAPQVSYPTYEEFSLAVEQRLDSKSTVAVTYVGNHGYHEPVANGGNNLTNSKASAAFFPNTPTAKPFASFATVTNIYSGASSNYNGVVLSATRRSKDLSLQFNYEFSKALDEVSNGGLEPFAPDAGDAATLVNPTNIAANYGPADYNVKHNITASFVYDLPSFIKSSNLMRNLSGGFEFSGDAFHQSGLPYSITQSTTAGGSGIAGSFANGGVLLLAKQASNSFDHHCGGENHVINVVTLAFSQACGYAAPGVFVNPTNYGQQSRNSLVGPSFTDVNFGAFKTIVVPHYEFMKLKLGAQFFNAFNHTNFQNPSHGRGSSNATLGTISSTVAPPTSILGSTGGADASPRLIQLHASLTF
jgi:hypothetical protein